MARARAEVEMIDMLLTMFTVFILNLATIKRSVCYNTHNTYDSECICDRYPLNIYFRSRAKIFANCIRKWQKKTKIKSFNSKMVLYPFLWICKISHQILFILIFIIVPNFCINASPHPTKPLT